MQLKTMLSGGCIIQLYALCLLFFTISANSKKRCHYHPEYCFTLVSLFSVTMPWWSGVCSGI